MLPELPDDIVRSIYYLTFDRYVDQYYDDIAKIYNVRPTPAGTYDFLYPIIGHERAFRQAYL